MITVDAKKLLWLTKNSLFKLPVGNYNVKFADQTIGMSNKDIVVSWHYWEMYRVFKVPQMMSKTAVRGRYTSKTHEELGRSLLWDIYIQLNDDKEETFWNLSECFCNITNQLYNTSCVELSEYVTSVSLHDCVEIYNDPRIVNSKIEFQKTLNDPYATEGQIREKISLCYQANNSALGDTILYPKNGIAQLFAADLVASRQTNQFIGPRGFIRDVDGSVKPNPVPTGYLEGLKTLYSSLIDSRSASYSTLMNQKPLQESEYLNRTIQLAVSSITTVDKNMVSCDRYITIPFLVTDEKDELLLRGKYHMVNNRPQLIWKNIKPLIGKIVHIRSITGCGHPNPQHVCKTCLGFSYKVIPPEANLGLTLAIPLNKEVTQKMLSNKHVVETSSVKLIELDRVASKWLRLHNNNGEFLYASEEAVKLPIIIRIDLECGKHLPQILHTDVNDLNVNRVSTMKEVSIGNLNKHGEHYGALDLLYLQVAGVGVHLSKDVLHYIKKPSNTWITTKNYIDITLHNWSVNKPIFAVPQMGEDIWTFFKQMSNFILASGGGKQNVDKITKFLTRGDALVEFITILKQGIPEFNIVSAEAIIRALMVVEDGDRYDLPKVDEDFHFTGLKKVISQRSLSAMLIYERQFDFALNTHWHSERKTTIHPMDGLFITDSNTL